MSKNALVRVAPSFRNVAFALTLALGLGLASAARADLVLEGSVGKGAMIKPTTAATPTTVMVSPGYRFLWIAGQLGVVGSLGDVENSKFDLELRPMVTIAPPLLPIYGRLVLAVQNLLDSDARAIAYGPVLGFRLGLAGIGIFAEAGLLPRNVDVPTAMGGKDKQTQWIVEGRLGASYGF